MYVILVKGPAFWHYLENDTTAVQNIGLAQHFATLEEAQSTIDRLKTARLSFRALQTDIPYVGRA